MKPRILFLVPAEYDALRKKGVDRMIAERDEEGFFERVVTVHPLAQQRRTIDVDAVHRIYELGVASGLAAAIGWVAAFRAVVRIAREERVDLVRANDAYAMGLLGWWVARSLGIPFCVSVHADYAKRFELSPKGLRGTWRRRMASVIPPFVLPRADLVLPIRRHLTASLEAAGAKPGAIRVIPHGIDLAPFTGDPAVDARAVFGLPAEAKIVSFVGRLTADNYAADLAAMIERIARRRTDTVFVVVGEGPEEPQLRRLLGDRPALASALRLFPFQPYDRVVALRRVSDASICLMGGFSLIEACAAGSPVIAYDVEWHRELVEDDVTGHLVTEHDVDAAVAALESILEHPAAAAAMGERARRAAFARHDRRETTRIKQQCYTELLEHRRLA